MVEAVDGRARTTCLYIYFADHIPKVRPYDPHWGVHRMPMWQWGNSTLPAGLHASKVTKFSVRRVLPFLPIESSIVEASVAQTGANSDVGKEGGGPHVKTRLIVHDSAVHIHRD